MIQARYHYGDLASPNIRRSSAGPTCCATSRNEAEASGSMRTMYRFHASPTSSDETATVRHRAASSPSASWSQTRSRRNSRRPRADSGRTTWPGPGSRTTARAARARSPTARGTPRPAERRARPRPCCTLVQDLPGVGREAEGGPVQGGLVGEVVVDERGVHLGPAGDGPNGRRRVPPFEELRAGRLRRSSPWSAGRPAAARVGASAVGPGGRPDFRCQVFTGREFIWYIHHP